MAETEKTFKITIDTNAVEAGVKVKTSSVDAATGIDRLTAANKELSATMGKLKGDTVEVKQARAALSAQIKKNTADSSALAMQLVKEGTSFAAASKAAKKHADALAASDKRKGSNRDKLKEGGGLGGGFLKLKDRIKDFQGLRAATGSTTGALRKMAGEANLGTKALNLAGSGASSLVGAVGGVALGAAAAGAAVVGAVVGLAVFAAKAGDAAQAAQRSREALWGNAKDARNLGDQIQVLAGKTSLGVDQLNSLEHSLSKTKLSGKAVVNTMNAVAQVTSAVDDEAGKKVQDIITRGQQSGRMHLGLRELQGTGIDFDEVAKEYAAGTKKSIGAARKELLTGRATLEQGADALAKVTTKKFGKLNEKSAFSLSNGPGKIFDQISNLAKDVDLSGISEGFKELYDQLRPGSPLGSAIKSTFEFLGGALGTAAKEGIPAVIEGLKWLGVGALRVGTYFYVMKKKVQDVFNKDGWAGIGRMIIDGLVDGLKGAANLISEASNDMALSVKNAFKNALGIKSPSRVFKAYGKNISQGAAIGVEEEAPKAVSAVREMSTDIEAETIGPRLGGSSGAAAPVAAPMRPAQQGPAVSATPTINGLHLHFHNMKEEDARAIAGDAGLLAQFTKIVVDAAKASGTPSPVAA